MVRQIPIFFAEDLLLKGNSYLNDILCVYRRFNGQNISGI